jgi:hypothetical protein
MTVVGPPKAATERFLGTLEDARRVTGLRVHTVALAVVDADDAVGWARLTELGTRATMDGQRTAVGAVTDLMGDTLERAGALAGPVQVPTQVGAWGNGTPIRGTFAQTETVVRNRVAGGATFAEARAASADYLTGVASSEVHRVARDGQLDAGLSDPRFGRFRRVAEPGACDWCRMLATRGAVYLTEESAGKGKKYHKPKDNCHVELVIDTDVIAESKVSLSKDWRNAIRDQQRMQQAGAMRTPETT